MYIITHAKICRLSELTKANLSFNSDATTTDGPSCWLYHEKWIHFDSFLSVSVSPLVELQMRQKDGKK